MRVVLYLWLSLSPGLAGAWPPTFGPEFEFRPIDDPFSLTDIQKLGEAKRKAVEEFLQFCKRTKKCEVDESLFPVTVKMKDGWSFSILTDPGTLEVTMSPMTVAEVERRKDQIQEVIFDTFYRADFAPALGNGHIHIGLQESGLSSDPRFLRNFAVDFFNHSELADGILQNDFSNAPSVALFSSDDKERLKGVIEQFDKNPRATSHAFSLAMNDFYRSVAFRRVFTTASYTNTSKYVALNFMHANTLEIRSFHSQRSAREYLFQIRMLEARLNYVRSYSGLIPMGIWEMQKDKLVQIERFAQYLKESGLNISDYRWIMRPDYRSLKDAANCGRDFDRIMFTPQTAD